MNRLFTDALNVINKLSAIIIVLMGIITGNGIVATYSFSSGNIIGPIFGGLIGAIVAVWVCGFISCIILIERHLKVIASNYSEININLDGLEL